MSVKSDSKISKTSTNSIVFSPDSTIIHYQNVIHTCPAHFSVYNVWKAAGVTMLGKYYLVLFLNGVKTTVISKSNK